MACKLIKLTALIYTILNEELLFPTETEITCVDTPYKDFIYVLSPIDSLHFPKKKKNRIKKIICNQGVIGSSSGIDHLMSRADSLENTLMLGKIKRRWG